LYLVFISALAYAAGMVLDKIVLSIRKVNLLFYITVLFLFLFVLTGVLLFFPFSGHVQWAEALSVGSIVLFFIMIGLAMLANYYFYRGMAKEQLQEVELIAMLTPIVTVLFAAATCPDERKLTDLIPAIIVSGALIFAHLKKGHLQFSQYSAGLVWAVIFGAGESIFIKLLLEGAFPPFWLYFLRTGFIFIFFGLIFRPHFKKGDFKNLWLILAAACTGVIYKVFMYYGYKSFGISYTTLVLILGSILVFFAASYIFGENLKKRKIIAAIIILACIIYASFA
jgi:drug/metabolite transporter (DMT)-like permease